MRWSYWTGNDNKNYKIDIDQEIRASYCKLISYSFFFFLNNFGFSVDFSCFWLCGYVMEFLLQLTEDWGEQLFSTLSKAGGKAFSNMAVGYNNVDVDAANKYGVAVGNTPVSFFFSPL